MRECEVEYVYLLVSKARIEMCRDIIKIELMPIHDVAERHDYVLAGRVDDVINELEKLINDIIILKTIIKNKIKEIHRSSA
jgi:hypothetical protein